MSFSSTFKSTPKLKKIPHRLLIPRSPARRKAWVKLFINLFTDIKGKSTTALCYTTGYLFAINSFQNNSWEKA